MATAETIRLVVYITCGGFSCGKGAKKKINFPTIGNYRFWTFFTYRSFEHVIRFILDSKKMLIGYLWLNIRNVGALIEKYQIDFGHV